MGFYSEIARAQPGVPRVKYLPIELRSSRMSLEHVSSAESNLVAQNERRARVLLAEDDRALRRFLQVVLERAGFEVIPAADGLEAMKLALSSPVDVVVTDAMMPNLSGHEFCRFLRNSQTLSDVPIVLLSALERKEQYGDQVNAFLAKPVSAENLVSCIQGLLKEKK